MIKQSTYRIYYGLVTVSLVLLTGFLVFWNYSNYQKERAYLSEHGQLAFENAIRNVEEGYWQSLVMDSLAVFKHNKILKDPTFFRRRADTENALELSDTFISADSSVTIDYHANDLVFPSDQPRRIIRSEGGVFIPNDSTKENRNFQGMMSLHIISTDDEDSVVVEFLDSIMYGDVTAKVAEMTDGNIKVMRVRELVDSLKPNDIVTGTYVDQFTGETYAARISGYQWDIWKRIWPQTLFSVVLLLITGLAFFIILRTLRQNERLALLKNDFISNMTHELKTPITTVGVALEALQNFNAINDPVKSKEYIDISKKELQRLTILVDKVLKMALFEKEEADLKLENVDLKLLVNEVVNSMKLHFEKFKGFCSIDFTGIDFTLNADKIHLTSVIYNLLDNGLKYSPNQPEIAIHLESTDDEIILSVEDNGIGIGEEYQDKIFDKFFRIPNGDAHTVKGYGLGLAYIKSVINQHGGTIKVDSGINRGTKFTINLPKTNGKG